ncbi:MAG: molybdopterin-dependent oxidoreductase [Armatimonadetes bacterium]|nr:molybdopterin-dependent oxidoreductase [Armatimonadota bacterium]
MADTSTMVETTITLTINGQACTGQKGQTILEVAEANGINIPTLCRHPWLTNHGACRMCVVQVENERRLVTSCAAPAVDGQVVTTHNEHLSKLRQMSLELLFAERNHICPFCPATGNCELQGQAYREGITHTRYDYIFPVLQPDTSAPYFVQDHNRCIVCGRCVRACNEIVGVGTLNFGHRGSNELVIADLGVPLGESSCINCGTCVDVCPTGALFEKRQPYFTRQPEMERKLAICPDDDLGCAMAVLTKSGLVARVEGAEEAPVNGPLLSWRSRYQLLEEPYQRVLSPLVRNAAGVLEPASWDEALDKVADGLSVGLQAALFDGAMAPVAGLCSGRLPSETLEAFHQFVTADCRSMMVDTLRGDERRTQRAARSLHEGYRECDLEAIREADMVLVVGFDPMETHPVLGAWLAGLQHHQQVPIVSINARQAEVAKQANLALKQRRGSAQAVILGMLCQLLDMAQLTRRTDRETQVRWRSHPPDRVAVEAGVPAEDIIRAAELYAQAKRPVILYGPRLTGIGNPTVIGLLWEMAYFCGNTTADGAVRVRGFHSEANAAGAEQIGFRGGADLETAQAIYLLAGDDPFEPLPQLREELEAAPSVVLQASHLGPLTEYADVVLPSLTWSERGGSWVNVAGLVQSFAPVTSPPAGVLSDEQVLARVRARLAERQVATPMEAVDE